MREGLIRRSPIDGIPLPSDQATLAVAPAAAVSRFILRADHATAARLGGSIGLGVPTTPMRAETGGERAALWLGPDEWLLLAPETDRAALQRLVAEAGQALSLVDVGDRQIGLTLTGNRVEEALNVGCPLPLDPRAFPIGKCTRTLFGKSEIILWRTGETSFRVEVQRSFAPYLVALLAEAVAGLP
jgi:sarcosine oxidase subunit gamma